MGPIPETSYNPEIDLVDDDPAFDELYREERDRDDDPRIGTYGNPLEILRSMGIKIK
jgi:hypothetical protein